MRLNITALLLVATASFSSTAQTIFQKEYQYPYQENEYWNVHNGVMGLPDGGFMLSGYTSQSNGADPILVKTDDNGTVQWAKTYSAEFTQQSNRTIRAVNGDFIMAGSYGTFPPSKTFLSVIRTNATGTLLWAREWESISAGNTNQQLNDVVELSDGSLLAGGGSTSGLYAPLMKLSSAGAVVWTVNLRFSTFVTTIQKILPLSNGDFLITGKANTSAFVARMDQNGATIWANTYSTVGSEGKHMIATSDGNYMVLVQNTSNVSLLKINGSGGIIFGKSYPGASTGYGLREVSSGNILVSGHSGNIDNVFKTDASGNYILGRSFNSGYTSQLVGRDIALTTDGGLAIVANGKLIKFRENMTVCSGSSLIITPGTLAPVATGFSWNTNSYSSELIYSNYELLARMEAVITDCGGKCTTFDNLHAAFNAQSLRVCKGYSIDFTNMSTGNNSSTWYENGIPFSTATSPSRVFNVPGTFTIKLVVGSVSGCSDTTSQTITVMSNCGNTGSTYGLVRQTYTNLYLANVQPASDGGFIGAHGGSDGNKLGLVKLDSMGVVQWNQAFADVSQASRPGICEQTNDGGYVAAGWANPGYLFVYKLNSAGVFQWANHYRVASAVLDQPIPMEMTELADGSMVIVGYKDEPSTTDYGWIIKIDNNGNVLWERHFGGTAYATAVTVVPTSTGGVLVGGWSSVTGSIIINLDNNGTQVWARSYGLQNIADICKTPDGNYAVVGRTTGYTGSVYTIALLKITPSGDIIWSREYGYNLTITAYDVMYDEVAGGFVITFLDPAGFNDYRAMINTDENGFMLTRYDEGINYYGDAPRSVKTSKHTFAFGEGSLFVKFTGFNTMKFSCNTSDVDQATRADVFTSQPATVTLNSYSLIDNQPFVNEIVAMTNSNCSFNSLCNIDATFTAPIQACTGQLINLTNTSIGGVSYVWRENGVAFSTNVNETKTYVTPGTYAIRLTATGTGGCKDSTTINIVVGTGVTANAGSDVSIACGGNTTLGASGGTTYAWTPSTGLSNPSIANPVASPTTTTTYTVTVSNGGFCTATDQVTVTVTGTVSQPGAISGNTTVCAGSAQTYSISPVAGATSYTWTLPGGWTGTSTTTSINTTAGSSGGNISVVANGACGSSIPQTLAVIVNSTPATPGSITGNTSVCQTSSNTYSITAVAGATSYTWTLPGGWSGTSTTNAINTTAGATSGNITVTANNSCGSSSAQTLAVSVTPVPSTPGSITGNTTACSGSANTYSISAVAGATSYTWTLPGGWSGTSTTNTINTTAGATGGTISVTANNACGSSAAQTLAVTVNTTPSTPGSITGNTIICSGSSNTYSITAVAGATSYTWTLPGGWTGTSTTNSINTTASATSGNVTVTANNSCGSSSPQTLAVTVNTIPATPGTISGAPTVCLGSSNTYSITAMAGATSYTWTLPAGWSGTSTTNSINTTAGATGGNITVTANNSCGSSGAQTFVVSVNSIPGTPGAITGNSTICSGSSNTYSIPAVAGAVSYTWTLPGGWSGTSTTNSINTTASLTSGNITVTANNICGSSPAQTLVVTVNTTPSTPGSITGNTTICSGSSNTYSITAVAGATSYTWTLPSGWTGTSTTNSINTTSSTTSGNVTVTANNSCGSSAAQTLAVSVNTIPATPGTISGNTIICNGSFNTYSITAVPGATSYTWTLPGGWSGTSSTNSINTTAGATGGNITVTANNTCGSSAAQTLAVTVNSLPAAPGPISGNVTACAGTLNTYSLTPVAGATSYTWTLPAGWSGTSTTNSINATAGTTGGMINVTADNACGSVPQSLLVNVITTPSTPGSISGNTTVCSGSSNTYSISNVPDATSYTWSLPGGWTGTSTTNTINTTANAGGGTVNVTATNVCGTSAAQTLTVLVITVPVTPSSITGNTSVCDGSAQVYSVISDPQVASYTWTLPSGWSGTSTTSTINATAGSSGGTISVTATNSCGTSAVQTLAVTVITAPATPSSITGNTVVCSGNPEIYSVVNDPSATSYAWTLPATWTGTSTTNSINTTTGTGGGTLSVTATNTCGTSAAQTLVISLGSLPATPGSISGNATVCSGTNQVYSVAPVAGATSYNWTIPGTWTGSSSADTIGVTVGTTGGIISVTAQNGCGTSPAQTLNVTVNISPTVSVSMNVSNVCFENGESMVRAIGTPPGGTFSGNGFSPSGMFDPVAAGIGTHTVTYTFTDANGCTGTATDQVTVSTCVSVSNLESQISNISVYPNPTNGIVTLSGVEGCGKCSLVIYSVLGDVIYQSSITGSVMTIDIHEANPGMYFLQIKDENTAVIRKIVKE